MFSNSSGSGTNISWSAYDTSTGFVDFTFSTAQGNTNYYVEGDRERFDQHLIDVVSKTTTGFRTKWINSDNSLLSPSLFGGIIKVFGATPTISVGSGPVGAQGAAGAGAQGSAGAQGAAGESGMDSTSKSSGYTLVAGDDQRLVVTNSNITVPTGVFSAGDAITIYNNSGSNITINQGGTMYLVGTSTTGNRVLAQRGLATIVCVASNTFVISGGGLS